MNIFLLIAFFLAAAFCVQTAIVREVARKSQTDDCGWTRAMRFTSIRFVPALAVVVTLSILVNRGWWLSTLMIGLTVDSLITICWLRRRLDLGAGKLFRAWFTQGVLNVVAGAIILFSASQCFTMQTWGNSSMSPNIRGYHVIEELPDGTHLINAATNPGDSWPAPGSESGGIVAETFEFVPRPRPDGYTHTADRFLCNKSKTPNRWDAIVFEPPAQPGFHSVKRLIGLPGERIRIRDGYVWVNGERLAPPERLGPIRYTNWTASAVLPEISLGLDEFFVLGDNPNKALDSRIWGPIPSYSIVGVAEVIYWPPSRWRMNP